MNPELEELEAELKMLQAQAPNAQLKQAIASSIQLEEQGQQKANKKLLFFKPLLLGVAASLALIFGLRFAEYEQAATLPVEASQSNGSEIANNGHFDPVSSKQILTDAVEEGVFLNENNEPVRQFRYQFVDSVTLKNRNDGALYSMMVPREEVVLVPVSLL